MNDPVNKEKYRQLRLGKCWDELFGTERSAEIRARMSESRKLSPVACAGWNAGIPMTDETKEKLFAGRDAWFAAGNRTGFEEGHVPHNVGVPMTDDQREKLNAGRDEYQQEHGGWNKGMTMPEEFRQAVSEGRTGKGLGIDPWNKGVETGPRSEETKAKISATHKVSAARQEVYDRRRGYEWTEEQRQRISEGNKTSEKAVAYHQGRIGKSSSKSSHGNYGITWRNDSQKWCVKIRNKKYGNFKTIEEAIVRRDEVVATTQQPTG